MWSSGPENVRARATVRQGLTRARRRHVFVLVLTPRARFVAARLAYVAVVLVATATQLDFSADLAAASQRLARAFTPSLGWRDAIDGLRNAALFGGLGVVWVVSSPSGRVRAEIWRATLVALVLSATVEGLQVFSPVRTASIVDVTTNTLGACGGGRGRGTRVRGGAHPRNVRALDPVGGGGDPRGGRGRGRLGGPALAPAPATRVARLGAGARRHRRIHGAARRLGVAPVPAQDRRRRHRPAAHRGAPRATRVSVRPRGRLQRAARRAAVSALSAARQRARRLAAAPLAAALAGGVAGHRDRGRTYSDRRSLL